MIEGNDNDMRQRKHMVKEGYQKKVNLYNFIIFKNYDGTQTSRCLSREMYNKLFPVTCNNDRAVV
jgi:hypothetical protein